MLWGMAWLRLRLKYLKNEEEKNYMHHCEQDKSFTYFETKFSFKP